MLPLLSLYIVLPVSLSFLLFYFYTCLSVICHSTLLPVYLLPVSLLLSISSLLHVSLLMILIACLTLLLPLLFHSLSLFCLSHSHYVSIFYTLSHSLFSSFIPCLSHSQSLYLAIMSFDLTLSVFFPPCLTLIDPHSLCVPHCLSHPPSYSYFLSVSLSLCLSILVPNYPSSSFTSSLSHSHCPIFPVSLQNVTCLTLIQLFHSYYF